MQTDYLNNRDLKYDHEIATSFIFHKERNKIVKKNKTMDNLPIFDHIEVIP